MNPSAFQHDSTNGPTSWEKPPPEDAPQFGVVDIVEAFTAMRHEWRGQTKESRALAEQIQAAVVKLQALEAGLSQRAGAEDSEEASGEKQAAGIIAATDHQLTRAIAAIAQREAQLKLREEAEVQAIEGCFAAMGRMARWFARPLLDFILQQRVAQRETKESPAVEGLNLVLARLRRSMGELRIERIDVEGLAFDANIMNAIGTTPSSDCPAGHVAEQLSPCYRWQGKILRFADVRVAK